MPGTTEAARAKFEQKHKAVRGKKEPLAYLEQLDAERTDAVTLPVTNQAGVVQAGEYQFPASYTGGPHPDDKRILQKLELVDPTSGNTPFGQVYLEDADLQFFDRRNKAIALGQMDQWFSTTFDPKDPLQVARAKDIFPEYFARRRTEFERDHEVVRKQFEMNLTGVQSEEDLWFKYALENGVIRRPRDRYWEPPTSGDDLVDTKGYTPGMLNPFRMQQPNRALWNQQGFAAAADAFRRPGPLVGARALAQSLAFPGDADVSAMNRRSAEFPTRPLR